MQSAAGADTGPPAPDPLDPLDRRSGRAIVAAARIAAGLLWIQGTSWKRPPDFGEETGRGLHRFTSYAVEHEVFGPWRWVVEEIVLPNFRVFGWLVLLTEMALGAFLLVGLATRFWALVGAAMSATILLSVANAPDEWGWSYWLMIALHLLLFATAAGRVAGLDGLLRPAWADGRSAATRALWRAS